MFRGSVLPLPAEYAVAVFGLGGAGTKPALDLVPEPTAAQAFLLRVVLLSFVFFSRPSLLHLLV